MLQLQQANILPGGQLREGDAIELVNVSAAPEKAYHQDHVERFDVPRLSEESAIQPGDHLRVRARTASGQVSNWISLQARGIGDDTRNAQIGPRGMGITVDDRGILRPRQLGTGMLSEPGATLQLTNLRTGQAQKFNLDQQGQIPPDITLQGQSGDKFQLAVSDNTNNLDFSMVLVRLLEAKPLKDLEDPLTSAKYTDIDGSPNAKKILYTGPLFINGADASDVKQGQLGNCYFCAAAASVAHFHPDIIEQMMCDNGNGTYTVTFQVEDPPDSGQYKPTPITVDGELYVNQGMRPLYGSANSDLHRTEKMEMWFPILEKAYAALQGQNYQKIESGWSHKMMMSLLGSNKNDEHFLPNNQSDQIFKSLSEANANGWPGTAVTYELNAPESSRYAGARIYASHAYSVLGTHEENDQKYVRLRNPWGSSEPGYDGLDDGIFLLEIDKFSHYFQWLNITHSKTENT